MLGQGVHKEQCAILVDGDKFFGFVKSVSGRTIRGHTNYDNLTVEIGMGSSDLLLKWVKETFEKGSTSRRGKIYTYDSDYQSLSVRDFYDAQIVEINLPVLDGAKQDPVFLTVNIRPAAVRSQKDSTRQKIEVRRIPTGNQWKSSHFFVSLGNLPTRRVAKVDGLKWSQAMGEDQSTEVSNLRLTLAMSDIHAWQDWFQKFVIAGQCELEIQGAIELLSDDFKNTLARFDLFDCGIISLTLSTPEAFGDQVTRFCAEMYVGSMAFHFERPPTIPRVR